MSAEARIGKWLGPKRLDRDELGRSGESRAALHYRLRGWKVLGRNVREGGAEIDLIVGRRDTIVFVEVKTRTEGSVREPWEAVDSKKRLRIIRAAGRYLRRHRLTNKGVRFDVISIRWTGYRFRLTRFEDAFQPMASPGRPWLVE